MTVLKVSHDGPVSSDRFTPSHVLLPSKRELLRDQLVQEFSRVQEENGFRNTVKQVLTTLPSGPDSIKSFPTIVVLVGEEEWQPLDTNRKAINSTVKVQVNGHFSDLQGSGGPTIYASTSAGEPLLDDMKRIFARLLLKNVNTTGSRWSVELTPRPRMVGPMYTSEHSGGVALFFTAKLLYQTVDL